MKLYEIHGDYKLTTLVRLTALPKRQHSEAVIRIVPVMACEDGGQLRDSFRSKRNRESKPDRRILSSTP